MSEEYSIEFASVVKNKAVFQYWKEKMGLVNGLYARKVLGVGEIRFKQIKERFNLETIILPGPVSWKVHLYKLKELKRIKEELAKESC